MTVQLELFRPEEMAPDNPSTRLVTITRPSEIKMPLSLAAEFADAGERVRIGLQNASAHLIEIGHELRLIKELLTRGEFVRQVSSACGLSPRASRSVIRAAHRAFLTSSMPQKGLPTRLGQKLISHVVKDLIRSVREHHPTSNEKNPLDPARRSLGSGSFL